MNFVLFKDNTGKSVLINLNLVTRVSPVNYTLTKIFFTSGPDDYITVVKSFEEVCERIQLAERRANK